MRLLHSGSDRVGDGAPADATQSRPAEEIRAALAGNICRCGAYPKIERAILRASGQESRMRPRFVRTQREMEGRFEDVWALVDEDDDLETWPEERRARGRRRPATRSDGPLRTSGAARYTVDVALPGMLEARVVRAPVARCRVTNLDVEAARAVPGRPRRARAGRPVHDGRRSTSSRPSRTGRARRSRRSPPTRGTRWPRASRRSRSGSRRWPRSTSTPVSTSSASRRIRARPSAATRTRRSQAPRCSSS